MDKPMRGGKAAWDARLMARKRKGKVKGSRFLPNDCPRPIRAMTPSMANVPPGTAQNDPANAATPLLLQTALPTAQNFAAGSRSRMTKHQPQEENQAPQALTNGGSRRLGVWEIYPHTP